MPKLRAPQAHGQVATWPDPQTWPTLVSANQAALAPWRATQAEWVGEVRHGVAAALASVAPRWAKLSRTVRPDPWRPDHTGPVIVTGHQAELFHPGVWVKNFAANALARALGGTAINLVLDTDAPRTGTLMIPVGGQGRALTSRAVSLANFAANTALAEQGPLRVETLRHAIRQVCQAVADPDRCRGLGVWGTLLSAATRANPAEALTAARLAAEAQFGLANQELPVSALPMGGFVAAMMADAPRFATAYNAAVEGYRRRHRVRGAGRPVPLLDRLTANGAAITELPLWGWRPGQPRQRLFTDTHRCWLAAVTHRTITANDLGAPVTLQCLAPHDPSAVRVAPRAIALTLLVRLCLADLFVHGIGGGLYDEVTDEIISTYYGFSPPAYTVITATLHLDDLTAADDTAAQAAAIGRARRDALHNPERVIEPWRLSAAYLAAKRERIAELQRLRAVADPTERRAHSVRRAQLHREVLHLNATLAAGDSELFVRLDERLRTLATAQAADRLARWREWCFALYRPAALQGLIDSLPRWTAGGAAAQGPVMTAGGAAQPLQP